MMRRTVGLLAAVVLGIAPRAASALDLQLEGFYGFARPPTTSFRAATSGTGSASDLYNSSLQLAGGDVLLNLNGLELGGIADVTFGNASASQTAIGALAGAAISLGFAKLDLLAEAGGHRFGNFAKNPDVVTASSSSEWLFYVGLRPGLSFKLGGPLSLGVWAFVRWDVDTQNVPVTVGSAGSAGSYKLGGTTVGATVRLGFDL
jgi:hypothetical protein